MCCVTRGREGGKGREGKGREGRGGEGRGGEGGRGGMTYTYYSDGTIYTDQQ